MTNQQCPECRGVNVHYSFCSLRMKAAPAPADEHPMPTGWDWPAMIRQKAQGSTDAPFWVSVSVEIERLTHELNDAMQGEADAAAQYSAENSRLRAALERIEDASNLVKWKGLRAQPGLVLKAIHDEASAALSGEPHLADEPDGEFIHTPHSKDCECKGHPFKCFYHPHGCGCTEKSDRKPACNCRVSKMTLDDMVGGAAGHDAWCASLRTEAK